MEKGKSSTLGSARFRFKSLRRVETKVEIENERDNGKRRVDVNNNIIRTIFSVLNPVFLETRPT